MARLWSGVEGRGGFGRGGRGWGGGYSQLQDEEELSDERQDEHEDPDDLGA
jgi:hypothetical protein